jgi:hypothetical protein
MAGHFDRPIRAAPPREEPMPLRIAMSFRWGKKRITISLTIRL